jgi:hypothetical protein
MPFAGCTDLSEAVLKLLFTALDMDNTGSIGLQSDTIACLLPLAYHSFAGCNGPEWVELKRLVHST